MLEEYHQQKLMCLPALQKGLQGWSWGFPRDLHRWRGWAQTQTCLRWSKVKAADPAPPATEPFPDTVGSIQSCTVACDSMFSHRNSPSLHRNVRLVAQRGGQCYRRLEYPHPSISSYCTPRTDSYKNGM